MNWEIFGVQRLKAYETRQQAARDIPERIKLLELEFTSIRSAIKDGMPSGNSDREAQLVGNIAKREELKANLEIVKREIELTERGLEALDDEEKRVLYIFFINRPHGHIELLCEELCYEKTKVYSLKDRALKKFTLACYGVVDV